MYTLYETDVCLKVLYVPEDLSELKCYRSTKFCAL